MKINLKKPIVLASAVSNPVPREYCGAQTVELDVHVHGSIINPAMRDALRPGDRLLLRTLIVGVERA